jgi:uncharacterized alkaline shock family protein YloU
MILSIFRLRRKKELQNKYYILGRTANGQLRISHKALKDLIRQSIYSLRGLKRFKSELNLVPDGLEILVSFQLAEGYNSEEVFSKVKAKITQAVQQYAGIKVKEVRKN